MKRFLLVLVCTLIATAAAAVFDQWAFDHVVVPEIYHRDWAMGLKELGTLYPWLVAALLAFLFENKRLPIQGQPLPSWCYALQKALQVLLATVFAGAMMSVIKLLVHRPRPDYAFTHGGSVSSLWQVFKSRQDLLNPETWTHARLFESSDSFPSGHATVAFAAAFALARLYPCAAWVWYALAAGCALTRVLDRAHHASDVVCAVGVGWIGAWVAWRLTQAVGLWIEARMRGKQGL